MAIILLGAMIFSLGLFKNLSRNNEFHQADSLNWISTAQGNLHIKTFKADSIVDSPTLAVVIHGDAPFNNPGYHYKLAQRLAKQKNVIAIGLLRPGYTDSFNDTSNGVKGLTAGDNYTLEVIAAISEAILKLKKIYKPVKTVLIGHSGGAAIVADLVSLHPRLAEKAMLVSCPCDLETWRPYMAKQQLNPLWLLPSKSISPISLVKGLNKDVEIKIVIGNNDYITPITISKKYFDTLLSNGNKVTYHALQGKGHEILLEEVVFKLIVTSLN